MIYESDCFVADTTQYIPADLADEMILMNLETGDFINLNRVSAEIWKKTQSKKISVGEIIEYLLEQYQVEKDVCTFETISCVEKMMEKQLIHKVQ